jgi:hypothetical protein
MDIVAFLEQRRQRIVNESAESVHRAHLRHYEAEGSARPRLDALFGLLLESLSKRDLQPIVGYATMVAEERFAAGYGLSEVQTAFNVLEETTWTTVLAEIRPQELAEALGLISTVLGAGKDALARAYVSLAARSHAPSLDLRQLFAGTDGP